MSFGLSGPLAEALVAIAFRVSPLTDIDADELIERSQVARLLHGAHGHPPSDIEALRDLLLRLSRLVEDVPEVVELEINPLIARPATHGSVVGDARVRLQRLA
ncbi:MAG: acetate--CoA ligase family protein [Dehalococcoidia bacterium]